MKKSIALLLLIVVSVQAQTIIGIGMLPGSTSSYAYGVSGDGSTVVGVSGTMAFRWTTGSGIQDLGKLAGASLAGAYAANYDGSIIVGDSTKSQSRAFRWSQSSGMEALDVPSSSGPYPWSNTMAFGISSNGLSISGYGLDTSFNSLKWGAPSYSLSVGQPGSLSWGTSGNGQVTVGALYDRIYKWSTIDGAQDLGDGYARGANYDGSVIVGSSGVNAFRWNESGGLQIIGSGEAISTSADGSIVVGYDSASAFAWTTNDGRKNLSQYLSDLGVDVSGWSLEKAEGISYDGSTIVGQGVFNGTRQAFVAMIPEPSSVSLFLAGGLLLLGLRKTSKNKI
jgi:uncharacterized membrane protein